MKAAFFRACAVMAAGLMALELLLATLLISTHANAHTRVKVRMEGKHEVTDMCAKGHDSGHFQSPVNLRSDSTVGRKSSATIAYTTVDAKVVNNGETVRVDFDAGNSITLDSKKYELIQMHFHAHAENTIDGVMYPLEAHFVHQAADGAKAVIAVLFKEGATNSAYARVFNDMPSSVGGSHALHDLDPASLLPTSEHVFAYTGSLTTEPCTEGVSWLVRKEILELSYKQIENFTNLYHLNARSLQPLNGRIVFSE